MECKTGRVDYEVMGGKEVLAVWVLNRVDFVLSEASLRSSDKYL